jgi:uncharacterized C2H2 Zn-finger protein
MVFSYIRTEAGEYKCPHCDYVKKNQSTVHMHIRAKHSGTFKHKCDTCEYETTTKQNLEKHILSKHPEENTPVEKDHKCCMCTFETRTKAGLRSHYMLKHLTTETNEMMGKTETNQIQCTMCGEEFKSKPAFIYHAPKCLDDDTKNGLQNEIREILGC